MGGNLMQYKRPVSLSILAGLHALFLFAGIYPFLASIQEYEGISFWRFSTAGVLLAIPIFLSLIIMNKIRHFLTYFLAGLLLCGLMGLLGLGWGGPAGTVCGAFTAIFSLIIVCIRTASKIRFGREKKEFLDMHGDMADYPLHASDFPDVLTRPQPLHWIWFTLLYLAGMICGFTTCLYCLFGIVFFDIFVCLGFRYLYAFYRYVGANQSVARLPVSTMAKIHRMTGIFAAVVLLLFLLPAVLYGREFRINPYVDQPFLSGEPMQEQQMQQDLMPDISEMLPDDMQAAPEPPQWLIVLTEVLGILICIAFVCALAWVFLSWLRKIGREFATEDEDEVVFLEEEEPDTVRRLLRRRQSGPLSFKQQIRRRYRKMIRKATKGQPSKWATPTELEKQAALSATEEVQALHESYEIARYGK
jgi:hypothetical protein